MTAVAGAVALGSVLTADQARLSFDLFATKIVPRVHKGSGGRRLLTSLHILHGVPRRRAVREMKPFGRG